MHEDAEDRVRQHLAVHRVHEASGRHGEREVVPRARNHLLESLGQREVRERVADRVDAARAGSSSTTEASAANRFTVSSVVVFK